MGFLASVPQKKTGFTLSVKDFPYGALGNAVQAPTADGSITAGSTAFTSMTAAFTSAINGMLVVVAEAGAPISATVTGFTTGGASTITFMTSAGIVPVKGMRVCISSVGGVTGITTSATAGPWLGTITANGGNSYTAPLYTNSHTTTALATTGTYTSGGTLTTPTPLIATATYVSATSLTLSVAASNTVTTSSYAYGNNDYTAISSALTAAQASLGTLYFPPGNYLMWSGTLNTPHLNITTSGVQVIGAGRGASNLLFADQTAKGIYVNATGNNITSVSVRDLTAQYATVPSQRLGFSMWGIAVQGSATYSAQRIIIDNCEVTNSSLGIHFSDNCINCKVTNSFVYTTLADGFSCYGVNTPCQRISFIGNSGEGCGDDTFSDNSYAASSGPNIGTLFEGNFSYNSGSGGFATVGSNGCLIIGNISRLSFLAGIRCQGDTTNFYPITNTTIEGNIVQGAGGATGGLVATGAVAGILVQSVQSTANSCNNVTIKGNQIEPDPNGSANNLGPFIGVFSNAGGTNVCNRHTIEGNICVGPQSQTYSTFQTQISGAGGTCAIYTDNGVNATIQDNQVYESYQDGIYVGTNWQGATLIQNNTIDTPNTHAAASTNGIKVFGGNAPIVRGNSIVNVGTLAAPLQIYPQATATASSAFSGNAIVTACGSLTFATSGTVTSTSGVLTFVTASAIYVPMPTAHCHVTVTLGTTGPGAANNLYILLDGKIYVDLYNGAVSTFINSVQTYIGPQVPWTNYSSASGTIEAILDDDGMLEVYNNNGTRYQINSVYVPSRQLFSLGQNSCGVASGTSSSTGKVTSITYRY